MTREERSNEGINRWAEEGFNGYGAYPPRFGKTRFGIQVVYNVCNKYRTAIPSILVVIPNAAIRHRWELERDLMQELTDVPLVFNIMSATELVMSGTKQSVYLAIFDEVHRYLSDEWYKILDGTLLDAKFKLGLTGTPPLDDNRKAKLHRCLPCFDEVTTEEAVANGWVLPKNEFNIVLSLDVEDKERYAILSEPVTRTLKKYRNLYKSFVVNGQYVINNDFTFIQACYTGINARHLNLEGVNYITGENIRDTVASIKGWNRDDENEATLAWNPNYIYEECKLFMDFVAKRNEIIINNKVKLDVVIKLITSFRIPTIVFNESIDFAEIACEAIEKLYPNEVAIFHTKIKSKPLINPRTGKYFTLKAKGRTDEVKYFGPKTIRDYIIEGLNNGRFMYLCAVKALDEGIDVPNLQSVICTAGTLNPTPYIQRTARATTVVDNVNKTALVFNLVFDDFNIIDESGEARFVSSRDMTKLKHRQRLARTSPVWIYSLNDIDEIVSKYNDKHLLY